MNLDQLKQFMKQQSETDKKRNHTQITATTLHDALVQASIELTLPVKFINYDVLQKGNPGLLGVGKKDWTIIAYESDKAGAKKGTVSSGSEAFMIDDDVVHVEDKSGKVVVRLMAEKVFIAVRPPVGNGESAELKDAMTALQRRGVHEFDEDKVRDIVKKKDSKEYIIAKYMHNPAADALADIKIEANEMAAYLVMTPPGPGGSDLSAQTIQDFLRHNEIVTGILNEAIEEFTSNPTYAEPLLVAKGANPVNGINSKVEHQFVTDPKQLHPKEVDGKVDFKNMNLIQNVVEGQVLAKKTAPTPGTDGFTVFGKSLPARPGEDIALLIGENVKLSDDGLMAVALMNGQVMLSEGGKITVQPVYVLTGDVSLKNGGNIDFIGTVIIKGNVEDGFFVRASKNIEISGSVGKSEIRAGGDIVVSQGIAGKGDSMVHSDGSIYAKFIENARVVAKGDVIVTDGIVSSFVDSNSKIICLAGKKARIVGGQLRASEKIIAKNLGSEAGSETIIEVGIEPEKRARFIEIERKMTKITHEVSELDLNLSTAAKSTKIKVDLSQEKLEALRMMRLRRDEMSIELANLTEEFTNIKEYLDSLKSNGEISVEQKLYPGVHLNICGLELPIKNDMKWITFYKDGPVIRTKEFQEKKNAN